MQWSGLTEEKQKNQLAQTEFRFTKTLIEITTAAAITGCSSPEHQRCTAAKDGKPQGGHREHSSAAEWLD
jgi:hypothetical protein